MTQEGNERADRYQDELSENIDDGSGCAETWEALGELRDNVSNKASTPRRSFIRALGVATGVGLGGTGALSVSDLVDAQVGPFKNIHRDELKGADRKAARTRAISDNRLLEVLDASPATEKDLQLDQLKAYQITYDNSDKKPLTQVLIPVSGMNNRLSYAYNDESSAGGIKVDDDTTIQFVDTRRRNSHGVERKREAHGEARKEVLAVVQQNRKYQNIIKDLRSGYDVKTQNAHVVTVAKSSEAVVYVPAVSKKEGSQSQAADDRVITAVVNTDSQTVTQASDSYISCVSNCLVENAEFFGICFEGCCIFCWDGVSCVCCVACMGIVGASCAARCA